MVTALAALQASNLNNPFATPSLSGAVWLITLMLALLGAGWAAANSVNKWRKESSDAIAVVNEVMAGMQATLTAIDAKVDNLIDLDHESRIDKLEREMSRYAPFVKRHRMWYHYVANWSMAAQGVMDELRVKAGLAPVQRWPHPNDYKDELSEP